MKKYRSPSAQAWRLHTGTTDHALTVSEDRVNDLLEREVTSAQYRRPENTVKVA